MTDSAALERAALAVILDGRYPEAWGLLSDIIAPADAFAVPAHRLLAVVMRRMVADCKPLDALSTQEAASHISWTDVTDELAGRVVSPTKAEYADSVLARIGGAVALSEIAGTHSPRAGFTGLVAALKQHADHRGLVALLTGFVAQASATNGMQRQYGIIDEAINALAIHGRNGQGSRGMGECAEAALAEHDRLATTRAARIGAWGLPTLDANCSLAPGALVTLAAAPGGGKTSLALQAAVETCAALGTSSVAFVSLEMAGEELASIILARELGVPRQIVERGGLTTAQRAQAGEIRAKWQAANLYVKDSSATCRADDICAWIRQRSQRSGGKLALVCLDYLQLLDGSGPRQTEYERLSQATRALKRVAMDCKLCVLLLSQLTREGRKAGRTADGSLIAAPEPQLSDLRGSGSIESDSNAVVMLWPQTTSLAPTIPIICQLAKNRGGILARTMLAFHRGDGQRFAEIPPVRPHKGMPDEIDSAEDRFNDR